MNILVTGGAGYIGSHTVQELKKSRSLSTPHGTCICDYIHVHKNNPDGFGVK